MHSIIGLAVISITILGTVALASIFAVRSNHGLVEIMPNPLIWYENTGSPGLTVSLGSEKQFANITAIQPRKALIVYDYNSSAGIVVRRTFVKNVDGVNHTFDKWPSLFSFQVTVLGVEVLSDPNNTGVVLAEVQTNDNDFFSFYYYNNSVLEIDAPNKSTQIKIDPLKPHILNITLKWKNRRNPATAYFYVDGSLIATGKGTIKARKVNYISAQCGRYDISNMYRFLIDHAHILFKEKNNEFLIADILDDFEDGTDKIFIHDHNPSDLYDTYYTIPSGEQPYSPSDNSVGTYIAPFLNVRILDVFTSFQRSVVSILNATQGCCNATYPGYTRPIRIEEKTGQALTNYSVVIELNQSNFGDWDKLNSNGSDIYFTDASGNPLYYWIVEINKTAQRSVIHVKIPHISAHGSTTIYLHYGGRNPYSDYRRPDEVYVFYDDFNYSSLDQLLASGKWVPVNTRYVINVSNGKLYVKTSDNVFVLRTKDPIYAPFEVEYSLASCVNQSQDWDSGIAIGWDNDSEYVAYVDDTPNHMQSYGENPLAITEGLNIGNWLRYDIGDEFRRDNNWRVFHVYAVKSHIEGDVFLDLSDGRVNHDDYYDQRTIVNDYGNISGYIWIVNDGDAQDTCAIYNWIAVRKIIDKGVEPAIRILPRVEPRVVEWFENATLNGWTERSILLENSSIVRSSTEELSLIPVTGAAYGNLSSIWIYSLIPPGRGYKCTLNISDPYMLNSNNPNAVILLLLSHNIYISQR
jgi:hypothetical protein